MNLLSKIQSKFDTSIPTQIQQYRWPTLLRWSSIYKAKKPYIILFLGVWKNDFFFLHNWILDLRNLKMYFKIKRKKNIEWKTTTKHQDFPFSIALCSSSFWHTGIPIWNIFTQYTSRKYIIYEIAQPCLDASCSTVVAIK